MKAKLFIALPVLMVVNTYAQKKEMDYGKDSVICVQNLSVYSEFYKQKNYEDAYSPWMWALMNCPGSSLYLYSRGTDLVEYKINKEKDALNREKYIDTLFLLYDKRIENFGQKGYVLGRKGADMLKHRKDKPAEAFSILEESVTLSGNKSEAGSLVAYLQAATLLLKEEKIAKEKVIDIYDKTTGFVDFNLSSIEDEKKKSFYLTAKENIEALFEPLASCDDLVKLYESKFAANKENTDWLMKSTQLLDKKGCTGSATFVKIAETLHALKPSAESAYSIGKVLTDQGQYGKAAKFFQNAVDLQPDNNLKGEYYLALANIYFTYLKQSEQARSYAEKAAANKSGWGLPYLAIGDMYASAAKDCGINDFEKSTVYWVAVDKYIRAKGVDATIAEEANKKIATYSKYFPSKKDAFFYSLQEGQEYKVGCWINETTTVKVQ